MSYQPSTLALALLEIFGDSISLGLEGPSTPAKSWASMLGRELGMPVLNHGLGGSGTFEASKQGYIAVGNKPRAAGLWTWMAGYGDLNSGGIFTGTITKIQGCARAFLANAFLKTAVPASDASVTKTGAWSDFPGGMFSKSELGLGGTGKYSTTDGNTISWAYSGDSPFCIGFYNSDGTVKRIGNLKVSVTTLGVTTDLEYYCGDGRADGMPIGGNGYDLEQLTHETRVYPSPGPGTHTITVTVDPTGTGRPIYVDYFGVLEDPRKCYPVLMADVPYSKPGDYASTYMGKRSDVEQVNRALHEARCKFYGYPVRGIAINDWFDANTGMAADKKHHSDAGNEQDLAAFLDGARRAFNEYYRLGAPMLA